MSDLNLANTEVMIGLTKNGNVVLSMDFLGSNFKLYLDSDDNVLGIDYDCTYEPIKARWAEVLYQGITPQTFKALYDAEVEKNNATLECGELENYLSIEEVQSNVQAVREEEIRERKWEKKFSSLLRGKFSHVDVKSVMKKCAVRTRLYNGDEEVVASSLERCKSQLEMISPENIDERGVIYMGGTWAREVNTRGFSLGDHNIEQWLRVYGAGVKAPSVKKFEIVEVSPFREKDNWVFYECLLENNKVVTVGYYELKRFGLTGEDLVGRCLPSGLEFQDGTYWYGARTWTVE